MRRIPPTTAAAADSSSGRVRCWGLAVLVHALIAAAGVHWPHRAGFRAVSPFSDLEVYEGAARFIGQGFLPYLGFSIEYPPLAMPVFALPLPLAALLAPRLGAFQSYIWAFAAEMLAVDAVAVWLVIRQVERTEGMGRVPNRLAWYTAYFAILCPLDVTRFDLVPMLMAFAAALWLDRGRAATGGVAAGLGFLVKVVPGLMLLPWLAGSGARPERTRAARAFGLTVGSGLIAWYLLGVERTLGAIRYHVDRGVEINSLYASGYMLARELVGAQVRLSFGYGSLNIEAAGNHLVARLSILVQAACWLLVGVRARQAGQPFSIRLAGAALVGYLVGGKVLSPQYLIWLIPFAAVARSGRRVYLACCLLTTATYPWFFGDLIAFGRPAVALLLARNLALIWLFVIYLRGGDPSAGPLPARPGAAWPPPGRRDANPIQSERGGPAGW